MDNYTQDSRKGNEKEKGNGKLINKLLLTSFSIVSAVFITLFFSQSKVIADKNTTIKERDETISQQSRLHETDMRLANEKYLEISTRLKNTEQELEEVKEKKQEYYELYRQKEKEAEQLKEEIRRAASTGGDTEARIRLAELEGELEKYKAALDHANDTIAELIIKVQQQSEALKAAQQRITELEESLAASQEALAGSIEEKRIMADELVKQKGVTKNELENASYMLERTGDDLKDKRKFSEMKIGCYRYARSLLFRARENQGDPALFSEAISRLSGKMEEIKPGSSITDDTKRAF